MINKSKVCRVVGAVFMCVPLCACGLAELGAVQTISAAQRAKQANGGVNAEKDAKRKIEEAMVRAAEERSKAIASDTGGGTTAAGAGSMPDLKATGVDSAMKAAEEQSK